MRPASPQRVTRAKRAVSRTAGPAEDIDPAIIAPLFAWYQRSARSLPWRIADLRSGTRDPYRVLVSEVMLQQTQVARVVDKFERFLARFPTIQALASAPIDDVLAAWTGLGYYRRARLLHACARAIVERHAGVMPQEEIALRDLPGIGAYTTGAIASLAFAQAQPLVDTNVSRVLLRIAGKQLAATDKFASVWAWEQAARLVEHAAASPDTNPHLPNRPGAWNEALMELGATVCTLPTPRCESCPVRKHCRAFAMGTTATIPLPSRKPPRAAITHACLLIRDRRGRVLVEQRPTTSAGAGLWAGLWQLPTLDRRERDDTPPALIARELRLTLPKRPKWLARDPFVFKTTHRDVRFVVFELLVPAAATAATPPRRWCDREGFEQLGWSSPMKRLVSAALTSRGDRPAKAGAPAPRARRATRS